MRKGTVALAGVILAAAVVLAFLSWRSLGRERQERRGEVVQRAADLARGALGRFELELQMLRMLRPSTLEDAMSAGREGALVAVAEGGRLAYPVAPARDGPSLEERLRRESPTLLASFEAAQELEFEEGATVEASSQYRKLEERAESPGTKAALLHAGLRAALRGGRTDEAKALAARIATEHPEEVGESGLPYAVLAQARIAELDRTPEAAARLSGLLARHSLPGHVRAFLLRGLLGLAGARALERAEDAALRGRADEVAVFEGRRFLVTARDGRAVALPLNGREPLRAEGGITVAFEGEGPDAEVLARHASTEFAGLTVTAHLTDPAALEVPAGRALLTGGLVACLVAALLFGTVALLRTVRRELAVARMKGEFVSGVSHDLKTPLTSIRMFAEMLETGRAQGEEKRKEYARLIHRESLRLSRLVENVLDFSCMEEGRKTYAFAERPLAPIVTAASETFRSLAESADLRLDLAPEVRARVDADALAGAILNLLDNAQKYAPGPVEVRLAGNGDWAEITIADRGPGILAAERERVFEKFSRGQAAMAGPHGGAGLGLALVRSVIEAHGGSASVVSEPGKGSRFILRVPRCHGSSS